MKRLSVIPRAYRVIEACLLANRSVLTSPRNPSSYVTFPISLPIQCCIGFRKCGVGAFVSVFSQHACLLASYKRQDFDRPSCARALINKVLKIALLCPHQDALTSVENRSQGPGSISVIASKSFQANFWATAGAKRTQHLSEISLH